MPIATRVAVRSNAAGHASSIRSARARNAAGLASRSRRNRSGSGSGMRGLLRYGKIACIARSGTRQPRRAGTARRRRTRGTPAPRPTGTGGRVRTAKRGPHDRGSAGSPRRTSARERSTHRSMSSTGPASRRCAILPRWSIERTRLATSRTGVSRATLTSGGASGFPSKSVTASPPSQRRIWPTCRSPWIRIAAAVGTWSNTSKAERIRPSRPRSRSPSSPVVRARASSSATSARVFQPAIASSSDEHHRGGEDARGGRQRAVEGTREFADGDRRFEGRRVVDLTSEPAEEEFEVPVPPIAGSR